MLELNDLNQNIHLIPIGLSDQSSIESLFLSGHYDSTASTTEGFRERSFYARKEHIAVFRGDDAVEALGIDSVSILKIDVEGGELEVLAGFEKTLARDRPFVSCEVLPVYDETSENRSIEKK